MPENVVLDSEMRAFLRENIARIGKLSVESVDDAVPFQEYGLTSLEVVLLSGEIEDRFDMEIDPSEVFKFRTIDGVCANLARDAA